MKADDKEGIEIAIQCISEAFGVDPEDKSLSIAPMTLTQVREHDLDESTVAGL